LNIRSISTGQALGYNVELTPAKPPKTPPEPTSPPSHHPAVPFVRPRLRDTPMPSRWFRSPSPTPFSGQFTRFEAHLVLLSLLNPHVSAFRDVSERTRA
jgi:hypothetical protein